MRSRVERLSPYRCGPRSSASFRRRFLIFSALAFASAWLFVPAAARAQNTICKPLPIAEPLDQTDESTAELDIQILGAAAVEHVQASGPVKTRIALSRDGSVRNEILSMDLTGTSTLGPFKISISAPPRPPSVGGGTLDPATGRIDSFFDVFFDITVMPPNKPSQVYSNLQQPAHMELTKICPVHGGEQIVARQRAGEEVTIFAVTGQPIAIIRNIKHTIGNPPPTPCFPPRGKDVMDSTLLHDIDIPGIGLCRADLAGPVVVERSDPYVDPATGLTCIDTKIVDLNLQGSDPVCGKIIITLNPFRASTGLICEKVKGTCFPANSCFNVFIKVQLVDLGLCLYACEPAVMCCMIDTIPPFRCLYNLNVGKGTGSVPLYKGDCDATAATDPCAVTPLPPPAAYIIKAVHQPLPPKRCDCYPKAGDDSLVATLDSQIVFPGLNITCSGFAGPMVIRRGDPFLDDQGRCCIKTELVFLELKGKCSDGSIAVIRLCPNQRSTGLICAKQSTACFPAQSCFDVFFEIEVQMATGPMKFKNCKAATMCCMIDRIPPLRCPYTLTSGPIEIYKALPGTISPCVQNPLPPPDGIIEDAVTTPTDENPPCCPEYGPAVDVFGSNLFHDIEIPGIGTCKANLSGPVTVVRGDPYVDPTTGLCCVEVVMKDLNLQGVDPLCGRICITLDPRRPSKGRICSKQKGACFPATSCFDVFVRIQLKDLNRVLVACQPAQMCCMIDAIPPIGCQYQLDIGNVGRVPLYDEPTTAGPVGVGGGAATPCELPDNGTGTVTLPPQGCGYVSPDQVHMIIDGLPAGTTIQVGVEHQEFFGITEKPGGTLGGNQETFQSILLMNLQGTGGLGTFHRQLSVQAQCVTDTGPRVPGDPVQSFPGEMMQLQGQLPPGDPDFDLLRVTAGTGFGMPSPGHTTLTRKPAGTWAVDSFFDITYRIDFVGHPGGSLMGMSGSTTGTIRMQTGGGGGGEPPTDICRQNPPPTPTAFIVKAVHQPEPGCPGAPPAGDDVMDSELSHRIRFPGIGPAPGGDLICDADMHGQVVVRRGDPHVDPVTGHCVIETEIVRMSLTGIDPICGQVRVRESPTKASLGRIISNGNPGDPFFPANSFFDVFIEVEIANAPGGGSIVLENCLPARMECGQITSVPPFNCVYELNLSDVQLYRAGTCGPNARPVASIELAQHIPRQQCDKCPEYGPGVDTMDSTLIHDIDIFGAGGRDTLCTAELHGAVVVERGTPYTATDTAGNVICCVSTRMLKLDLTGNDPICGDIRIRLCPERPSRGTICQMPGMATCFPALSCFDVFIEVEVMGMILKNCKPVRMCCKISRIPPFECVYELDPAQTEPLLLFKKGDCDSPNPTPVGQIRRVQHVPKPPCDPPVPFVSLTCAESPADGKVIVKWENNPQCPCAGRVQVTRTDPAGGVLVIPVPAGGTSISDLPDPKPFCVPGQSAVTFKYCVQCLSANGAVVAESCCEVTIPCPPENCNDCIESIRCESVGDVLVIKWSYKPNCNPPCSKIEIHRRESAASTTLLGTVGGTETEFRLPCKPGEYCIRCICEDGTPGAFHCCTATCGNHPFRRCDSNCSGVDDLSDDIFTLNQLFVDPTRRTCCELAQDCNGDGKVDLSDAVYHLGYKFLGTRPPPPPYPDCGADGCPDYPCPPGTGN